LQRSHCVLKSITDRHFFVVNKPTVDLSNGCCCDRAFVVKPISRRRETVSHRVSCSRNNCLAGAFKRWHLILQSGQRWRIPPESSRGRTDNAPLMAVGPRFVIKTSTSSARLDRCCSSLKCTCPLESQNHLVGDAVPVRIAATPRTDALSSRPCFVSDRNSLTYGSIPLQKLFRGLEIEYSVATAAASRGTTTTPADPERLGSKCTSSLPQHSPTASNHRNCRFPALCQSLCRVDDSMRMSGRGSCSPTSLKEIPKRVLLVLCFSVIVLDDVSSLGGIH
jgi:hypothetical protein